MASPSPTRAESPNKPRSTSPRHRSHTSPTLVDPELVRRSIGQSAVAMTSWMTDRTHCHPAFPPVTRLEQEREGHTAIVRSRKVHDRARSVLDGIYGKKKEEPAPPPPEPAKERSVTPDGAHIPAVGPKEEEQPAPPPPQPTETEEQPEKKQEAPPEPAAAPAPVEQEKERAAPPPAAPAPPFPFEGSMYKFAIGKSATGRKNWKERWFTFDNKGLSYSEEKGSKALGTILLFEATAKAAFVAVPSKAMHDACDLPGREILVCFDEEGKRLKLLLRCNTDADKAKWVDVFRAKLAEHTQA